MLIALILEILILILLMITAGNRYKEYCNLLKDNNEKLIRIFIPAGLYLFELIRQKKPSAYERKIESKLFMLAGPGEAKIYMKIHIAKKSIIILLTIISLTFIGTQVNIDIPYIIFSLSLTCLLFYVTDRQLDGKVKERRHDIQLEFPEFLNKLVLLVDAGLTVRSAIKKIVKDNHKNNPLYKELTYVLNEINSGSPDIKAYELFAKRCQLQEVTLFTATLLQNIRRGSSELIPILRLQAGNCWINRKNIARKLGEEASTKLVFPMILVFIAILIMVVAPAIFQLNL